MDYLVIQLAHDKVTAARFGVTGKGLSFAGAVDFTLDHEHDLARVAREIGAGVQGNPRVVLSLPPEQFAQRRIPLALADLRKVREVLPSLMQGETALPAEEAVFDALPADEGRCLAVWARRDEVRRMIELFRDGGCEPQVVTCPPCAWPLLPGCPDDAVLLGNGTMAVLSAGRVIYYGPCGDVERARQIMAVLESTGVTMPQQMLLVGDLSGDETGELTALPLPERLGEVFRSEDNFRRFGPLAAIALACQAGRLPDFRRGDLAWTAGDAAFRRRLVVTCLLAAVAVVLLFAREGLRYRALKADIASLNGSITAAYREVFPSRPRAVDEISEIRGEIRKLSSGPGGSAFLDALKLLADAKGNGISGLYEAELDGKVVRIKGDARSSQAVGEYRSALVPLFASVETGEQKSRPDGGITFTLSATLKEAK